MHERRDDATIDVVAQRDRAETMMTETTDDEDNASKDVGNNDGSDDGSDGDDGDNDDDGGNANGGSSDNGDNQDSGNDDEMTTMRQRQRR